MASSALAPDDVSAAEDWVAAYRALAPKGDALADSADPALWSAMLGEIAKLTGADLIRAKLRAEREADEIGTGFRLPDEKEDRKWPLSPVPLMIHEREWAGIEAAVIQRACIMEMILADVYGPQTLVSNGALPAAMLTGSPQFLRSMVGETPPGGWHLHFYAVDIGRGPDGAWRVLADHSRTPTGAGYALENRLAVSRVFGGLHARLNIHRLAPFFAAVRAGIAAACSRDDPRIAMLTPGRLNPSYAEQAHLARYLGLLLVEGEDLAVHDDRLYLRTIEGLKRVDAIWRRIDPRLIDPLAFDARSRIGVPGLIDAMAAGNVVVANAPGAGVIESPAFMAFMPALAKVLTGEALEMPNIATWWCGSDAERDHVESALNKLVIAPAFQAAVGADAAPRLGRQMTPLEKAELHQTLRRRGIDIVGQEIIRLSTLPIVDDDALVPRPFTVRVFAARQADGMWVVMPGGFARIGDTIDPRAALIGEGAFSADVCVVSDEPVKSVTLMAAAGKVAIRRNPGTLPSRVADNLFWLGRYLERAESVLALVRGAIGGTIDVDGGAALGASTMARLANLLVATGAASRRVLGRDPDIIALARAALDDPQEAASVRALVDGARMIGAGTRERLASDVWRLLDAPFPRSDGIAARATVLHERFAALAGLAAENMGRTDGWHFLDAGRRIERAIALTRLMRAFGHDDASADDLTILLDLTNSQIGYRQRYPTGLAPLAVRDLIMLDKGNPRSLAFQVTSLVTHLDVLPRLRNDGMAEDQQVEATALAALLATHSAATLDVGVIGALDDRLMALSDAIARRYFLRGGRPLRAPGLTLA